MSDIIEKLMQAELRIANKHLPMARKSLAQLLSEEIPYIVCRDGSIHMFRRSELLKLRELVDYEEAQKLLLPIVIQVRADIDTLTGFIENELEATVIRRILGIEPLVNDKSKKLLLYKPQLYELRSKFSTIFQIAIVVDLDSIDVHPTDMYSLTSL